MLTPPFIARLKRLMPASLFARAMLILLVPVVVLQLLVAHIFYDRHWGSVVRNMSEATAADVAMLAEEYRELSPRLGTRDALLLTKRRGEILNIRVEYRPDVTLSENVTGRHYFHDFYDQLSMRINAPIRILPPDDNSVHVRAQTVGGALEFRFPRKRLASATTMIFFLWMVGSALLLTLIAILFLRNQIRPIVQLAQAAEQFGIGQEASSFTPRGAREVRAAGRAFVIMADRIRRQVQNRTEMLAGISHDLRTPLTRMQLEIELGKVEGKTRGALQQDIREMESMIDAYLDFARGDRGEALQTVDLSELLQGLVADYQRGGAAISFAPGGPVFAELRPQAIRRALANLLDNALRYGGGEMRISAEQSAGFVRVKILDQGPGIPEARIEELFKPFTRGEPSRNAHTGGVGLGLSIARAIAQRHGGDVTLENITDAGGKILGLAATLRLPRAVRTPLTA